MRENNRASKSVSAAAIVPAAGSGTRLGMELPKPLVHVGGTPLVVRTIAAITEAYPFCVVLVPAEEVWIPKIREELSRLPAFGLIRVIPGGRLRAQSVRNAFEALTERPEVVLIHDVARPFIKKETIGDLIETAFAEGAALLAEAATATVKKSDAEGRAVESTLDRNRIFLAQTPQVFACNILADSYSKREADFAEFTDECGLVEAAGYPVSIVRGESTNIKITTPADLRLAEAMLRA